MKFLSSSFIFLVVINFHFLHASEKDFRNSDELIERANQLYDSGKYEPAIRLLERVSPGDPNYVTACYELALNFYASGNNEKAMARCREALFLRYEEPYLYSLMGSILDESGNPRESIRILTDALKKWPYNQNLLYNLGVCYFNAGKPDSAAITLQKSVVFYPYHTRSHIVLANANYAMGRIAESYLAFSMSILLSPNATNIGELEKAIGGKLEITPRAYLYPYPNETESKYWNNLKDFLDSELAFNKEFDYPYQPDFTFTRQSYILFSHLHNDPSDTSMYTRLYGRFFSEILRKGLFETYINYCMNNVGYQSSESWNKKNPGKIDNFIAWAQEYIDKGRLYAYRANLEGDNKKIHHFNGQKLTSIGEMSGEKEIRNGNFIILSDGGGISERGTYVNDIAEGRWLLFWPDGKIRQDLNFLHDQLNDTIRTYYPNGALNLVVPFKSGNRNGLYEEYTSSGKLIQKNYYNDNLLHGKGTWQNFKENFSREYTYQNDTLEGNTSERWMNGQLKSSYSAKKGDFEGPFKSWYVNGNTEEETFYTKGIKTGQWLKYHYNGVISDSGAYDGDGNLTGKYKSFDEKGRLTISNNEYIDGKINGTSVSYFKSGRPKVIMHYSNDTLKHIDCYDDQGKMLYASDAIAGSIVFKSYYDDGTLIIEGTLLNGRNQGVWKTYNTLGVMITEKSYKDGLLAGPQKTYFPNGALSEEYFCDSNNIIGNYKSYYLSGRLHATCFYEKDGIEGEYITYYKNDSIRQRSFYHKGKQTGRSIAYHPDGLLKSEEFYNSEGSPSRTILYNQLGQIETDWIYDYGAFTFHGTYPNGNIKSITHISDNLRNGIQEVYYPNGQLAWKLNYTNGEPDGKLENFDYKGNLTAVRHYTYGESDGAVNLFEEGRKAFVTFYENGIEKGKVLDYYNFNGQICKEIETENDQRNGFSDYYSPDGTFMYRIRYADGSIKGYSWKNAGGGYVPEKPVDLNTKEIVTYYPDGKISARISLKSGLYHGNCVLYYPGGSKLSESVYNSGDFAGTLKEYYPDGKMREVTEYVEDDENGSYVFYYPNGNKKISGNFLNASRHGDWQAFDESGRQTETIKYHHGEIYEIVKN